MEDVLHTIMFEDLTFTEFVLDILESHRMLRSHGVPDRADGIDEVVIRRVMASDIVDLFIQFCCPARRSQALEFFYHTCFFLLGHKARRLDGIDQDHDLLKFEIPVLDIVSRSSGITLFDRDRGVLE